MGANRIRVVFDTNVIISAVGFGGIPLAALLRAFKDDVQLLTTEEALAELDRVMGYGEFEEKASHLRARMNPTTGYQSPTMALTGFQRQH